VNDFIISEKKYPKSDLIKDFEDIFHMRETTLQEIWENIVTKINICDNACGSGAFLLAVAHILFDINKKIIEELSGYSKVTDTAIKRIILKQLYGVDINSRAIEIALLRLWLWLVDSYKLEHIEPLPKIEYNLRVGNSLFGYIDIEKFGIEKITLDDFMGDEESLQFLLNKFKSLKNEYRKSVGISAHQIKNEIENIRKKINKRLNKELFRDLLEYAILDIDKEEYFKRRPFHPGLDFYEIFDLKKPKESRGFDIVVGNPPYIRVDSLDENEKKYWKEEFSATTGKYDIYYLFIEHTFDWLKKGGICGYIVPNKFCAATSAEDLRKIIIEKSCNCSIVSVSHLNIFKDAANYPIILIFKKGEPLINLDMKFVIEYDKFLNGNFEGFGIKKSELNKVPMKIFPINITKNQFDIVIRLLSDNKNLKNYIKISEGLRIPSKFEKDAKTEKDDFEIVKQFQFGKWSTIDEGSYISKSDLESVISPSSTRYKNILKDKIVIAEDGLIINANLDDKKRVAQGWV
jgi:hypothetical protein